MNDRRVYILAHDTARRLAAAYCMNAPEGYVCTIEQPKKSRVQEEKYHAMIGDIAASCKFRGKSISREDWKRLLIAAFVYVKREEAQEKGEPNPFPEDWRIVPGLVGDGVVQLGVPSRMFSKRIASEFIEYLYAWGTENGAVWSESENFPTEYLRESRHE